MYIQLSRQFPFHLLACLFDFSMFFLFQLKFVNIMLNLLQNRVPFSFYNSYHIKSRESADIFFYFFLWDNMCVASLQPSDAKTIRKWKFLCFVVVVVFFLLWIWLGFFEWCVFLEKMGHLSWETLFDSLKQLKW